MTDDQFSSHRPRTVDEVLADLEAVAVNFDRGWSATAPTVAALFRRAKRDVEGARGGCGYARDQAIKDCIKVVRDLADHMHDLRANEVLKSDCRHGNGLLDGYQAVINELEALLGDGK